MKVLVRSVIRFAVERSIYEVVMKHREDVLASEAKAIKELEIAYNKAVKGIETELKRVLVKIGNAKTSGLDIKPVWLYQEARLETLLSEIETRINEFAAVSFKTTAKQREYFTKLGAQHASESLNVALEGHFSGLNSEAVESLVGSLKLRSPLAELFDTIGPDARKAALDVFVRGAALGWNPRKIGRALYRESVVPSKRRAQLIARTEPLRAYRVAQSESFKKNADVIRSWRWTCARNRFTCSLCLAMDGEEFPVDEPLQSHPACRCTMMPVTKRRKSTLETGEDWFAKQGDGYQNAIIGRRKAEMYRAGKITLKDNVQVINHPRWGKGLKAHRLDELDNLRNKGQLWSQGARGPLSGFAPAPLSDPVVERALAALEARPKVAGGVRHGMKVARAEYRTVLAQHNYDELLAHSFDEVLQISDLGSPRPAVNPALVREFIANPYVGKDPIVVVRYRGREIIHDGLQRIEAGRLRGAKSVTARVIDLDSIMPVEHPVLGKFGVKSFNGTPEQALRVEKVLEAARKNLPGFKVDSVVVGRGTNLTRDVNGQLTLTVHEDLLDGSSLYLQNAAALEDATKTAWASQADNLNAARLQYKVSSVTSAVTYADDVEMVLAPSVVQPVLDATKADKALKEWMSTHYGLVGARAGANVNHALGEAWIRWRSGTYQKGLLPEYVDEAFIKAFKRVLPKTVVTELSEAESVLFGQIGPQAGSNPGGLFIGRDGVERYAKFYSDEDRARVEHLAYDVYRKLGVPVPNSRLVQVPGKGLAIATDIVPGKVVGSASLSTDLTHKFLDGFVGDVLLANWDVVGLSKDNILLGTDGLIYRIDAGGSLIYRAQGGLKPVAALMDTIEEWATAFGPKGQTGPLAAKVGVHSAEDMAKAVLDQIARAEKAFGKYTSADWERLVGAELSSNTDIALMLEKRFNRIVGMKQSLKDSLKPKPVLKPGKVSQDLKVYAKKPAPAWLPSNNHQSVFGQFAAPYPVSNRTQVMRNAIGNYKGSGYSTINGALRQGLTNQNAKIIQKMFADNKVGLPKDVMLKRRLLGRNTKEKWHNFTVADIGSVISDKGFQSTSTYEHWGWGGDVELFIHARAGDLGFIPASSDPQYDGEFEMLMEDHRLMLVKNVEQIAGRTRITVEMLPRGFNYTGKVRYTGSGKLFSWIKNLSGLIRP